MVGVWIAYSDSSSFFLTPLNKKILLDSESVFFMKPYPIEYRNIHPLRSMPVLLITVTTRVTSRTPRRTCRVPPRVTGWSGPCGSCSWLWSSRASSPSSPSAWRWPTLAADVTHCCSPYSWLSITRHTVCQHTQLEIERDENAFLKFHFNMLLMHHVMNLLKLGISLT